MSFSNCVYQKKEHLSTIITNEHFGIIIMKNHVLYLLALVNWLLHVIADFAGLMG